MILAIGDLHLKENLGYADYIDDRRIPERQEILDFIVEKSKDCEHIVFLGDQLNGRNNSAAVIKEFVQLVERFEDKNVYILAGNHEKFGDGRSVIDFLREIKGKKWHIVTDDVKTLTIDKKVIELCPYFHKSELGTDDKEEATKLLMKKLTEGDILFAHHAISSSKTHDVEVDIFDEIVLPRKELDKRYKLTVAGHIHSPQEKDNVIVSGSIFNNEVGEVQKYIWKIDTETMKHEQIKLPGRAIYKLEDPTDKELTAIKKDSIVKVIITKKLSTVKTKELKDKLKKFDAYLYLEQIPHERKKLHFSEDEGLLDFSIDKLLEIYAKENKINLTKLKRGFELIK